MTQALYAHMNNKKIEIKKKRFGVLVDTIDASFPPNRTPILFLYSLLP
jgi:hypothetical protein